MTCQIDLAEGRKISLVDIPSATRWQDVVLGRMKWATITIDKQVRSERCRCFRIITAWSLLAFLYIEKTDDKNESTALSSYFLLISCNHKCHLWYLQIRSEADYLFMMDVDSVFYNRFGAESLSQLTGVLHRIFYKVSLSSIQYIHFKLIKHDVMTWF